MNQELGNIKKISNIPACQRHCLWQMAGRQYLISCIFFVSSFLFLVSRTSAITVGPSLLEVEAEPGEGFVQETRLFNETNQPLTLYPALENVAPKKEGGQPQYLGNKDALGAARWIKVPAEKVILKPGELKKIILNIRVPKMLVQPGGHYAALFWTDQPPQNSGIGTASRVGTIFLFKIKGQIKEELKLLFFEKEKDANAFDLRVENSGNTHLKPAGQITIFNWRRKTAETAIINPLGQLVLPQSQRDFKILAKDFGWGKYYARAEIYYGSGQKIISSEISFWSAPERLGLYVFEFVILAFFIWIIVRIARRKAIHG